MTILYCFIFQLIIFQIVLFIIYVSGFTLRLITQKAKSAKNISTKNSKTSNIIATEMPKYNDKDPPIAPVRVVICQNNHKKFTLYC